MTKEERDAINSAKKVCQYAFYVNIGEVGYDTWRLSILINVLNRTEAERDQWKARAEALERALYKQCYACTLFVIDKGCVLKDRPCECDNWQFNEVGFAGGRDRHE